MHGTHPGFAAYDNAMRRAEAYRHPLEAAAAQDPLALHNSLTSSPNATLDTQVCLVHLEIFETWDAFSPAPILGGNRKPLLPLFKQLSY